MSHGPGLCMAEIYPHFMETRMTEVMLSGGWQGTPFIQTQPSGIFIYFFYRITGSTAQQRQPLLKMVTQIPALAGSGQGRAPRKRPLRFTSGRGDQGSLVGWVAQMLRVKVQVGWETETLDRMEQGIREALQLQHGTPAPSALGSALSGSQEEWAMPGALRTHRHCTQTLPRSLSVWSAHQRPLTTAPRLSPFKCCLNPHLH